MSEVLRNSLGPATIPRSQGVLFDPKGSTYFRIKFPQVRNYSPHAQFFLRVFPPHSIIITL